MYPYSFEKCECGIDSIDVLLTHSDYCPKYRHIEKRECSCSEIISEDKWHSIGCVNRVVVVQEEKVKVKSIEDALKLLRSIK